MDLLFEQKLSHNSALGAHCLRIAASEYFEVRERKSGIEFPLIFLVLPMVFHRKTAETFSHKQSPGILVKVISEYREMPLGLQDRVESFSNLTLNSLNIAISAQLLQFYINESVEIIPQNRSGMVFSQPNLRTLTKAAKRIGHGLAELTAEQICMYLNIRF